MTDEQKDDLMQKRIKRCISRLLLLSMISASMNTAGAFFYSPVYAGEDGQGMVEEQLLPAEDSMQASVDAPATDLQTTDIPKTTSAAECTVRFELSGLGDPVADQIVPAGSLLEKPSDPAAEGFRFTGWYRNTELTIPWIFEEDIVTEDITLFASWEQEPSDLSVQVPEVPFENEEEQTEEGLSETEDLKTVSEGSEKNTDEEGAGENETPEVLHEAVQTERTDASPAAEIKDVSMADNAAQTTGEETEGVVENSNTDDTDSTAPEEAEEEEAEEAVDTDPDEDLLEEGPDLLDEDGTPGNWGGTMMNLTAAKEQAQADIDSGKLPYTVTVAVIDSGVDAGQSLFSGRIDEASCSFIGGGTSDPEGHGTHVAGIIAQNTPSAVKLMILKALDSNKSGYAEHVAKAIEYAADHGVDIINLSLGASEREGRPNLSSEDRKEIGLAISYAQRKGCLVVTSAGNDGREITGNEAYPAGAAGVVTVAAVTEGNNPELCSFSNYGAGVTFCAPGRQITSVNGSKNGTSMAAANVSAALALVKLYNPGQAAGELVGLLSQNEKNTNVTAVVNESGNAYNMIFPILPDQMELNLPEIKPERPVITSIHNTGSMVTVTWKAIEDIEYAVYMGDSELDIQADYTKIGDVKGDSFTFDYNEHKTDRGGDSFYILAIDTERYENPISENVIYKMPSATIISSCNYLYVGETVEFESAWTETQELNEAEWSCSDSEVVTIEKKSDKKSQVTGKSPGKVKITFLAPNGMTDSKDLTVLGSDYENSGRCGEDLSYEIVEGDGGKTLHIFGTGDMWNRPFPWNSDSSLKDKQITTVRIDEGVTSIGDNAFSGLEITEVTGMQDVSKIGKHAFSHTKLEEFTLPKNVREIDEDAFYLTAIEWDVQEDNEWFSAEDGVLFNKDKTKLINISQTREGVYVIPESVKEFEKNAFNPTMLTDIYIPEGVTVIAEGCFHAFGNGKQTLHLPDSVEIIKKESVENFFVDHIPNNLRAIEWWAFFGVSGGELVFPDTLTKIENGCFDGLNAEVVELPESITKLELLQFGAAQIDTLIVPTSLKSFGSSTFYNGGSFSKIKYRGFTKQFSEIDFAEEIKEKVENADFSIEARGEWSGFTWKAEGPSGDLTLTLSGNGNLPDVYDKDSLPWKEGVDEITKIVLEDGITGIGEFGFYNYKNLKEIHMTDSVKFYGENALRGDPELENFVYCPAGKTTPMNVYIEYLVFLYEKGLECKPAVGVTFGTDTPLKEGTDYTITYPKSSINGQGLVIITFKGNYADYGTFSVPVVITRKLMDGENIKRLSGMTLSQYAFTYNGMVQAPGVTVMAGRKRMSRNVNYRVSPANYGITNVGSSTVTVTGIGGYFGSFSQTFSVHPASIAGASVSVPAGPYRYYGGPNQPGPTVVLGGRVLRHGSDYSLTYANNVDAGTATVYVHGTGNYTGTCSANFKIEKIYQTMSMYVKGGKKEITVGSTAALAVPGAVGTKTYTSTDPSVVSVSKDGILTAKKAGEAVILVIAKGDHNYYSANANVKITVREKEVKKPAGQTAKPTGKPVKPIEKPAGETIEKQPVVSYCTHVQSIGWMPYMSDGLMSGTEGQAKRLEGIRIALSNLPYKGGIEYRTHVQTYGWQKWKKDNEMAGTSGEAKRLEAIQIRLTGELAKHYDVYYQTHIQSFGWSDWASNGEMCGSAGYAKRLEGIRIFLRKKGSGAPGSTANRYYVTAGGGSPVSKVSGAKVGYNTHVQTYGWQNYSYDGGMAGTQGEAKRLEGIHINLIDRPYDSKTKKTYTGSIVYRTHVQTYGWQPWKKNGQMSGTSGEAKRLEGIQIYLTGEMAKHYDIYYCVHAQTYGWLDWAKNGQMAGTSGLAKRLEGIKIKLVPKGGKAPGSTKRPNVVGGRRKAAGQPIQGIREKS